VRERCDVHGLGGQQRHPGARMKIQIPGQIC
jgi:hypothetical protein